MCTVVYLATPGLLSKNRDKEVVTAEEVVNTGDYLAVRSVGDSYFSLGINKHGVAFVSTAVNSPEWTRLVEEGEAEKAIEVFAEERKGQTSPTKMISSAFADIKSLDECVELLKGSDNLLMGYNVVLADQDRAMVVETFKDQRHPFDLKPRDVVTNHFRTLQHGAKTFDEYPSSFERFDYISQYLNDMGSVEDLAGVVHPEPGSERAKQIWRKGTFSTVSSSVIDLKVKQIRYTNAVGTDYTVHSL
ncbi:MAG: carcinine hydrolase/isopenicillin-N N-acyltransferase family protein [Magnetovibrio sp.]|nr:carcinine hydrolase/isopenicillin-N N-acyltransferase family protein [Magnetovibrio sp.]